MKTGDSRGLQRPHRSDVVDGLNRKYNDTAILDELAGSRADLRDHLGIDTRILVYPYGRYDDRYVRLAKQVGFVMGVTTNRGARVDFDDAMHIPRVRIDGALQEKQFVQTMLRIKHLQALEIGTLRAP